MKKKNIAKLQTTLNEKNNEISDLSQQIQDYNRKLEDLEAEFKKQINVKSSVEEEISNEEIKDETKSLPR